jgi:hypothetical protein
MPEAIQIKEHFLTSVVGGVYDTLDLITTNPLQKIDDLNKLQTQYNDINNLRAELANRLRASPPPSSDLQSARLTASDENRAEILQKCLNMSSRLSACQIDSQGRLMSGGVALKDGSRFEGLQANWDLIDTVTGADA